MAPHRLPQALQLRRRGCDLKLIVDSVAAAQAIAAFGGEQGEAFEVWIEIDTDGHGSGVGADDTPLLLAFSRTLHDGGMRLGGVLTHAGSSYELDTPEALQALAERARSEEHTSELQSPCNLVCRLLLEKKHRRDSQRRPRQRPRLGRLAQAPHRAQRRQSRGHEAPLQPARGPAEPPGAHRRLRTRVLPL